ncbi:MAG: DUF4234 domain-containing protein [Oscillospiraceae bacterium]|nr:DUF4234 domain-containing protein [Oscillospiraceae bacterium]
MLQNTKGFHLIAGFAFCLLALSSFGLAIRVSSFESVLTLLGYILVVVPLLRGKRSVVIAIGFVLMTAASFATALRYIAYGMDIAHVLQQIVPLLCTASAAVFALALTTNALGEVTAFAKKAFFLPSILSLVNWLQLLLGTILTLITGFGFWAAGLRSLIAAFLGAILLAVALFFAMAYLAGEDGAEPQPSVRTNDDADYSCGLVKHILLLLFTLGIWQCIWIYRTTRFTNRLESEEEMSPGIQLLLYLFVPFYSLYWTYRCAKRIDAISHANGLGSDLAVLCLILAIFVGIVPPILMQDQINSIVGIQRGTTRVKGTSSVEQELRKYKDLLDKGLITPEEYEAKRRQLLGL